MHDHSRERKLTQQFASKFAPLYTRRAEIIAGSIDPTDAEVEAGKASDSDIESDDEEEEGAKISEIPEGSEGAGADAKGIPAFWLTALRNHVPISETIEDRDEEALKALKDIRLTYLDDKPGFKLHFSFGPNEFFEDGELTKTYYYQVSVSFYFCLCGFERLGVDGGWQQGKRGYIRVLGAVAVRYRYQVASHRADCRLIVDSM